MKTRTRVLEGLRAAGSAGVSGETIAHELGVSRVTVAKHVSALRAAGYEIDARLGEGYRLLSSPDLPLPDEVAPLLTTTFWTRLEGGVETASTNDDARALADAGAAEGTVVLAGRQTSGRGRFGRVWDSPRGGVYLSAVLRPGVPAFDVAPLPLVIALGVVRGLEQLGAEVRVKWPNDVLAEGRKIAGVLLEMEGQAERVDWVVAGVGVNVGPIGPAFVAEQVPGVQTAAVAAAVLDGIAETYLTWRAEGFAALRFEFDSVHALMRRSVEVRGLDGTVVASGEVMGIDDFGRLRLATAEGERTLASGDVTLAGG